MVPMQWCDHSALMPTGGRLGLHHRTEMNMRSLSKGRLCPQVVGWSAWLVQYHTPYCESQPAAWGGDFTSV